VFVLEPGQRFAGLACGSSHEQMKAAVPYLAAFAAGILINSVYVSAIATSCRNHFLRAWTKFVPAQANGPEGRAYSAAEP
jgi:hypothetical protein